MVELHEVPEAQHAATVHALERALLDSLGSVNTQGTNAPVLIVARDASDTMIAGVAGGTSYGWLLIKLLWVDDAHRSTGLGAKMMRAAEAKGLTLGCHNAWLDTSNPSARDFYVRLGYETFGLLQNAPDHAPADHCRWFMRKALISPV